MSKSFHSKNIEMKSVEELSAYKKNPRKHSKTQVEQIAKSLQKFGFNNPILVDKNYGVIAGHGRLEAAKKLKLKHVPVVVLDHLSEKEKRAYIIADNRIAENSKWDFELLKDELLDVQDEVDLDLLGFGDDLHEILGNEPLDNAEEEGEVLVVAEEGQAVSIPGDVWNLGEHQIICGDSHMIYVDMAIKSWEKCSGGKAIHDETGETFKKTAALRGVLLVK